MWSVRVRYSKPSCSPSWATRAMSAAVAMGPLMGRLKPMRMGDFRGPEWVVVPVIEENGARVDQTCTHVIRPGLEQRPREVSITVGQPCLPDHREQVNIAE